MARRPRLYLFAISLSGVVLLGGCDEAARPGAELDRRAEATRERLTGSEGGRIVLRAIDAHGGIEAWYRAATSSYTWEYSSAGANFRFKSHLVADNRTRQVYHELLELGTPDNPKPVSGRFAWDGTEAWISPASLESPNPRFWATTGFYFQSIPFVFADPGLNYEVLPHEQLEGVAHNMVRVSFDEGTGDSPGDTYTTYVNQESGLVDAIRYTVTYGRSGQPPDSSRQTLFYYEDYEAVSGLTVATHFRGFWFEDGKVGDFKNEAWATDISFEEPFDPSKLERPVDARVQPLPD